MKKPLRLFSFLFFCFAVYLNLFFKDENIPASVKNASFSANEKQNKDEIYVANNAPKDEIVRDQFAKEEAKKEGKQ